MKNLAFAITFIAITAYGLLADAAETKKVCHAEKDKKGKEVQVCKEIKVHAKLNGTKVPPK